MSSKGSEAPKPEGEAAKEAGKETAARGGGGLGAWLPLIVTVLLMPALAYVTTTFLILPKVLHAREGGEEEADTEAEKHEGKEAEAGGHGKEAKDGKDAKEPKDAKESGGHGKEAKESGGKKPGKGKKQTVALSKMVVNVAGTGGARYLMSSATLVGAIGSFKETIEENKDQLLDLAISTLGSKTINDLEKPGARNQIRAELISLFNNALGSPVVQEIYFTEFAIQ